MKIEFSGHTYELRDELTGQDYLDLRRAGTGDGDKVDMQSYGHLNLVRRLTSWDWDKEVSEINILALPLQHYQVLFNSALKLETEEGRAANTFLLELWAPSKQEVSPLISVPSSKRPRAGSASSGNGANTE